MKTIKSYFLFLLCIFMTQFSFAQQSNSAQLNDNWLFLKSDLGGIWEAVRPTIKPGSPEHVPIWEKVKLPHCYNATDAVDPDVNYYQGPAWYKTQLEIKNPYRKGRTLLHFEGAGQKTEVYVYTTKVGAHVGGYDEWTVDISDAVSSFQKNPALMEKFATKIPLSVRSDNSRDLEMIPSDLSDFNLYGGIYRYLNLIYVPAVSIEQVFIQPVVDLKSKKGTIEVNVKINSKLAIDKSYLNIEIQDVQSKIISSETVEVSPKNNNEVIYKIQLKNVKLWSPALPQLYTCKVTINTGSDQHTITEKFGFRHFEFLENGPFMLNGSRLLLRGTHRHEDHAGVSAALSYSQMREEMKLIKDMGANFIRLGHYQQSSYILDLCDSLGILVWEEIPWCRGGLGGPVYQQQAKNMLKNMIQQHYNHPSIILWGLGNENDWPNDFEKFDKQKIRTFMSELHQMAHSLDPSRLTSIRRCDFCNDIIDVYSPSIWPGWYKAIYTDYKAMYQKETKAVKRFFHAEWGGDSHAGRHDEIYDQLIHESFRSGEKTIKTLPETIENASKTGEWSESYICNLFDWHLKEQENMPNLTGAAFWTFKDFSTPVRPDNPVPYVNQKGVTERDGTKKESYYVFQSYWAEKLMVHIYGHSWPTRWGKEGEEKMIKVYSNCDEAELFVNGKSQGIKKRNSPDFPAAGLRWNVKYVSGGNSLKVIAKKGKTTITDEIKQNYQTDEWGKPAQMTLTKIEHKGDTATIEVKLFDNNKIMCLDARNIVTFGLTGDGQLIENLGTASGSSKVELQNGRAIIRVKLNEGKNVASVKSEGIPTVLCKL